MVPRCHVSTRKGLFTVERGAGAWSITRTNFLGDNVTVALHDPRSGQLFAALNHGHFGVKLHRSKDGGATWKELAAPKYPPKPEGYVPKTPIEGTPADYFATVRRVAEAERRPLDRGQDVAIHPTAQVEDCILWDRVTIGAGSRLTGCIVADDVEIPAGVGYDRMVITRDAVVGL